MELDISGRTALVTGSTRGIGLAIAKALGDEGARLAINGRDPQVLADAMAQLDKPCLDLCADVTNPEDCRHMVETLGRTWDGLDILVCNVGSGSSVPPGQETSEEWRRVLDINLLSATNMIEAARPMLAARKGVVICISSICGLEALGAPVTYSVAKAALNAYVRGIARPLGRDGVRIVAVAPGNILFDGSVWGRRMRDNPGQVTAMLESEVAMRRLGTPEEIASLVTFLVSPRASFMTGTVVVADGGQLRS